MARIVLRKIMNLLLAGALLPFLAGTAAAQLARCEARADIVATLSDTFGEKQYAYGLLGPQAIIEVFVSQKGTWTMVLTGSDGTSCILAAGLGWETVPQPVGEATGATSGE